MRQMFRVITTIVAALVAAVAVPSAAGANPPVVATTYYVNLLQMQCDDEAETFSDEILMYVEADSASNYWRIWWVNDVDGEEVFDITPGGAADFTFSTYAIVDTNENDLGTLGSTYISPADANQGIREHTFGQDGWYQYRLRYVVWT